MFGMHEKIVKKNLHTAWNKENIPCYGFKYLSVLTDGAFNPEPVEGTTLNHFFTLKDSNRIFPIYGEMKNIPIGKNKEILYTNRPAAQPAVELRNGYGNIIFYLSNYKNDFISKKENCGFQWEKSFEVLASANTYYHFGMMKTDQAHNLAMGFMPDYFNKLIYLFKETSASTTKVFQFIFEDDDIQTITLVTDTLTELLLPAKRFRMYLLTGLSTINYDIMIKFLKS